MSNEYTIEYFIEKFEKIPAKKWCTGAYEKDGKFCALGHCGQSGESSTEESQALETLGFNVPICYINDGVGDLAKLGKTPRTRVLKYLRGLLKK